MDRALEALKICSQKLIAHNIRRHRLIAMEACRQALNGAQFLERVRAETGMNLEIINRQTEAHLAAQGCGSLMDRKADAAVLFDGDDPGRSAVVHAGRQLLEVGLHVTAPVVAEDFKPHRCRESHMDRLLEAGFNNE